MQTSHPQVFLIPEATLLTWTASFSKGRGPALLALAIQVAGVAELDCTKGKVWLKGGTFLGWTFPTLKQPCSGLRPPASCTIWTGLGLL